MSSYKHNSRKKKRLRNWWCCVWVTKKVVGSKKWLSRQVWRLSLSPSPGQRHSRHWSGSAIDDDKIHRYCMSGLTNLSLRKSPLSVPMLCNTATTLFRSRSLRSMPLTEDYGLTHLRMCSESWYMKHNQNTHTHTHINCPNNLQVRTCVFVPQSHLSVPTLCNTTSTFFLTRSLRSMPLT